MDVPICDRCGFVVRRAWLNVHGHGTLCDRCVRELDERMKGESDGA